MSRFKSSSDNTLSDPGRRAFLALFAAVVLAGCASSRSRKKPTITYDSSPGSQVLRTAMTQYGKPYKYGGSSPTTGFDCSGLIWWAYLQHGKKLPRTAALQSSFGKPVKRSQIRQGDILAFRLGRAWHTGLYAGRGLFLHSPASGGLTRVESLNSPYWKPKLKRIRRVF